MRSFLIKSAAILAVVICLLFIGVTLAERAPFQPGNLLFPVQNLAEQANLIWPDRVYNSSYSISLLERRIDDLFDSLNTKNENITLVYLEKSVDQAIRSLEQIPLDQRQEIGEPLFSLVDRMQGLIKLINLNLFGDHGNYTALLQKIAIFFKMAGGNDDSLIIADQAISLILENQTDPGGTASNIIAVEHDLSTCAECHRTNDCRECHYETKPAGHFPGQCSNCHKTQEWKMGLFTHAEGEADDCISCHRTVSPADHFPGQCSLCHTPGSSWNNTSIDHNGFIDCLSCHASTQPANHYPGQCSTCHSPDRVWNDPSFDHNGLTDCKTCHAGDAPANHYSGQCSNCHTTGGWTSVNFNHNGFTDCRSCHSDNAPANYFSGQCSNCHTTGGWSDVIFSHDGFADCRSCHSADAPVNHFPSECSNCHDPSRGWQ